MICVCGAIKRVIQNHGKSRSDMGGYYPEKLDFRSFKFIKTVWNFNKNNRKRYYDKLNASNAEIIILKNRKQMIEFLQRL